MNFENKKKDRTLFSLFLLPCSTTGLRITIWGLSLSFLVYGMMILICHKPIGVLLVFLAVGLWRMTSWARIMSMVFLALLIVGILNPVTFADVILRGNIENSPLLLGIVAISEGFFLAAIIVLQRHKDEFQRSIL
jgi:hypothetical protein